MEIGRTQHGAPAQPGGRHVEPLEDKARELEAFLFAQALSASGGARGGSLSPPSWASAGGSTSGEPSPFARMLDHERARAFAEASRTGIADAVAEAIARRASSQA